MAYRKNFVIPTSSDWEEVWTWWNIDPVTKAKTAAKDLADWSGIMQFRTRHRSPTVLAEVSTANGRMVLADGEGNITVSLPHAVLAPLAGEEAVCDCVLIDPEGTRHELFDADPLFKFHATE